MDISFVVPALNEESRIASCIDSVHCNVPRGLAYEILVGDHGSSDQTASIARQHGAQVHAVESCTVGELRNQLVRRATGRILVFLDADCRLTEQWRKSALGAIHELDQDANQVSGSKCVPPPQSGFISRYWFEPLSTVPSSYLGTGHMIVPAVTFRRLGGFDPGLISGEDYNFCVRARSAGARVVPRPNLVVIHDGFPTTIGAFLRREAWHGAGDLQSVASFLRSRVAVVSAAFALIQLATIVALLLGSDIAIALVLASIVTLFAASVVKFGRMPVASRIGNLAVLYLYLVGRFMSLFLRREGIGKLRRE